MDDQLRGDAVDDLLLDVEHMSEIAVVALGPAADARAGIDQLRGDAQVVAGAAHAARQQVVGAEIAAH
jgi:hypothetical protein